jgi:parvulin-like peptidyl-prolyl isomerase
MVAASVPLSEPEIKQKFIDQNIKMKGEYVFVNANSFADNSVHVTDADLQKYYDDHQNKFKVEAQRKVRYVVFQKAASHGDSVATKENLASLVSKAKGDTASFKSYVDIYSDRPYSKDTLKPNMLSSEALSALSNASENELVGPVASLDGYCVFKLLGKSSAGESFVKASHILIPSTGDDAKAKAQADEIYRQLKSGADFAKLAREKSSDPGSARNGGDLGWFGKGMMVKEFEDACLSAKQGEILAPIKTSFGYHIIKVTGRTSESFVVEKIVNRAKASGGTIDNIFNSASDFSYLTKDKKYDFDGEAKLMKYPVRETIAFKEDAAFVPGLGACKNLVSFAFDNSLGDVSKAFKTPAGYVVAKVSSVVKEGVKKFEEVKNSIKPVVIRIKKFEKAKQIAEKISKQGGNLASSAAGYSANCKFDTTGVFSAETGIAGIGRDYGVIDNALKLNVGSISAPLKGMAGYYVVKLYSKTPYDNNVYKVQRNSLRDNLLNQKRQTFFQAWVADLKKHAVIKDNRSNFYGK